MEKIRRDVVHTDGWIERKLREDNRLIYSGIESLKVRAIVVKDCNAKGPCVME